MIDSAIRDIAKDVKASTQPPHNLINGAGDVLMPKTEEPSDNKAHLSGIASERAGKESQEQDTAADSEAETLIESPEKRKNNVANAPILHPTGSASVRTNGEKDGSTEPGNKKTRKRKRDLSDEHRPQSHSPSSSPLSSPNPQAHTRDSDSDVSDTPRSARSYRARRNAPKLESESANGASPDQTRRRRPSDIVPPTAKYQSKGIGSGTSDRRETRSATYPRPSSEDRSPSPRPTSRGQHRRGMSTQLTSGEFERKKRGRPPNISTKRNKSLDRAQSTSSGDGMSPPNARPSLEKYDPRDRMSPAKPSGPRKFRDKNGRTFLSRACNNEDLDKVKQCFRERPNDLNEQDNAGNTPLQIASLEGYVSIVQFLLENGAEVDTRNIDQDSPLIDAVENGHLEVVKLLLDFGANPRLSNRRGDEPYELVPRDDENYKEIRKLIADAKEHDFMMRRKSSGDNNNEANREGSSRPASAASPRDSPPLMDPRGIPAPTSRRRTGRSESTRNDLLWQSHTQENLRLLASKGNVQGVATILNVLQKAEPAAVIAAAKAGRDDVLQLILAIGDTDPNPDPLPELGAGFNTPMLAAIGRGNLKVIQLLIDQTDFNPTKKFRGKTYHEIAQERKGTDWPKEVEVLKKAYDKHMSGKPKTKSPKKVREPVERAREKRTRRSESPPSSSLRTSSSPTMTNKGLPDKALRAARRDGKKDFLSPTERERRKVESFRDDNSIAVASDQEQTVYDKGGHKHRRSQSDLPLPPNLESENTQRRRRLVTGKEHRRTQSGVAGTVSDDSNSELEVKGQRQSAVLKRNRSSLSPEPKEDATSRPGIKKRRTVLESSPEEARPNQRINPLSIGSKDAIMKTDPDLPEETAKRMESLSPELTTQDAAGEPDEAIPDVEPAMKDVTATIESPLGDNTTKQSNGEEVEVAEQEAFDEQAAETQRKAEEEKAAADRAAAEKAEAERIAAEEAAAELEEQRRAAQEAETKRKAEEAEARRQAEEAEALRKTEEAEARRKAEEVEARRRAEEETAARKKEEEERRERYRREQEDIKRRQEEQIRQQHLEIERRRRENLNASLCYSALLLQNGDPEAKSFEWLSHFVPLKTFKEQNMDGPYTEATASEEWIANFQAAVLLGTSDLNLRNYTSFEKRSVTPKDRQHLWMIFRNILSYDWHNSSPRYTTTAMMPGIEKEQRARFMAMNELFWVKLSDFKDQVFRHEHLAGLDLWEQSCSVVVRKKAPPVQPPQMANGSHPYVGGGNQTNSSLYVNGGPR